MYDKVYYQNSIKNKNKEYIIYRKYVTKFQNYENVK